MKDKQELIENKIEEYKEVFQMFDKDEDGVLSFEDLTVVMKLLGQRQKGWYFYSYR